MASLSRLTIGMTRDGIELVGDDVPLAFSMPASTPAAATPPERTTRDTKTAPVPPTEGVAHRVLARSWAPAMAGRMLGGYRLVRLLSTDMAGLSRDRGSLGHPPPGGSEAGLADERGRRSGPPFSGRSADQRILRHQYRQSLDSEGRRHPLWSWTTSMVPTWGVPPCGAQGRPCLGSPSRLLHRREAVGRPTSTGRPVEGAKLDPGDIALQPSAQHGRLCSPAFGVARNSRLGGNKVVRGKCACWARVNRPQRTSSVSESFSSTRDRRESVCQRFRS